MRDYFFSSLFLLMLHYVNIAHSKPCERMPNNTACTCEPESLQIRCVNDDSLTGALLKSVGNSMDDDFNLLYIKNNSKLITIEADSFIKSFVRVFVEDNAKLATVNSGAFKSLSITTELVFKNNSILASDLFGVLNQTSSAIQIIDFRGNMLSSIPENAFTNATVFANVQFISLDSQTSASLTVEKNAFANLVKLRQLTLDHKAITLNDKSINLAGIQTPDKVVIYIENTTMDSWNPTYLSVPNKNPPAIWLSLRGNLKIGDNIKYEQFSSFLTPNDNKLYVSSTSNRDCTCENVVELLKLNDPVVRVSGLVCKNIDLCINGVS